MIATRLEGKDAGKRGLGNIRSTVNVSPLVHPDCASLDPDGVAGFGA